MTSIMAQQCLPLRRTAKSRVNWWCLPKDATTGEQLSNVVMSFFAILAALTFFN